MARVRVAETVAVDEGLIPGTDPAPELQPEGFRNDLHRWYAEHARELPWRGKRNPYGTWLSEIMLQQTRVATVIDRYVEFLRRFPTLESLAMADEADVLALWSGMGYYRRARMLHRAAQFVVRELGGKLPRTCQELRSLPGVGDYTAAAIASIAFGESVAVVDGNVERVLLRVLGKAEDATAETRSMLKKVAQSLVPAEAATRMHNPAGTHNQAMMELGATICLPRQPLCLQFPVVNFCRTRGEHPTPKRKPQRSRVVAYLLMVRRGITSTEVLLEKRAGEASLMPGMLELPPLPLDAVEALEPVLRVRHAITNTNYYVQIYTPDGGENAGVDDHMLVQATGSTEEDVLVVKKNEGVAPHPLLRAIPAAEKDLRWMEVARLADLPLTGLARKVLPRLRIMRVPTVRLG